MTIYSGSRYEYSLIDFFSTKLQGDENPTVFYTMTDMGVVSYYEHVYGQGERLDLLATKYYGTPQFWWVIAEYNPEIIDFTNIPAGTTIRVPRV
jgi:hypothetical protein